MTQNVSLECIKVMGDPFNYSPTIYFIAGTVHFSKNKQAPEARSLLPPSVNLLTSLILISHKTDPYYILLFLTFWQILMDQNSVVDVTTYLGMDGPGIEYRGGTRFSSPFQTVPGAHLVCCKICTRSLSRAKLDGAWRLPPTPSSVEIKKEYSYISILRFRLGGLFQGKLILKFTYCKFLRDLGSS
jgi:hypothetical protein